MQPANHEQMRSPKQRTMLTISIGVLAAVTAVNTIAILRTHSVLLAMSNLVVAVALFAVSVALILLACRAPEA